MNLHDKARDLARAAASCEWEACISLTAILLKHIPVDQSFELVFRLIEHFQPFLENEKWIHTAIQQMRDALLTRTVLGEWDWLDEMEIASPGAGNFTNELENLWDSIKHKDLNEPLAEKLSLMMAGLIMAQLDERWAREYPEQWQKWYSGAKRSSITADFSKTNENDEYVHSRSSFWSTSAVQSLCQERWGEVADFLIKLVNKPHQ